MKQKVAVAMWIGSCDTALLWKRANRPNFGSQKEFLCDFFFPSIFCLIACESEKTILEPSQEEINIDVDADGFGQDEDCDDTDASINPSAVETCDGLDNNCDGNVDEGVTIVIYTDADGDGYGDENAPTDACGVLSGYASNGTDCDDEEPEAYPGNPEVCDGFDNDCNGLVDDEDASLDLNTASSLYVDADGDGFGDPETLILACSEGENQVLNGEDCDDQNEAIHPDADEVCDGADNDCDGLLDLEDDSIDQNSGGTFYADADGDTFGDASQFLVTCEPPEGYVADATDCNDEDGAINPAAVEICDGMDNDCDLFVDDADANVDTTTGNTYYLDTDSDGFGDAANSLMFCSDPGYGYSSNDQDCDDSQSYTYPGAAYQEGSDCLSDYDGDGYAPLTQGGGDCDDENIAIVPQSTDLANDGIDQNCDGVDGTDMDGDGFASQVSGGNDCDDSNSAYGENCPPAWGSVEIVGTLWSTEELTCVATAIDPDGDTLTYTYRWVSGGNDISSSEILSAGLLGVGESVECCAVASDGSLDTTEQCSATVTIENQPPSVSNALLSPSAVYTNDVLTATASAFDADVSQTLSLNYDWHVVDASTGADSIVQSGTTATLDGGSHFDKNDEVYVVVTPNDGVEDGTSAQSNAVTVLNTAPDAPEISLSADNDPAQVGVDDLTCSIDVESTDIDGDSLTYDFTWYDSNGDWAAETLATSDLSNVYSGTDTTVGTWTCEVVANDGVLDASIVDAAYEVEEFCTSLRFDGSNDYVEVAHDATLSITGDYTIEFWLRNDDSNNRVILSKNNGYSTGYTLRFDYYSGDPNQPMIRWGHDYAQAADYDHSYGGTSWIHLAVVGNTSLGTTSIWINGEEASSGPYGTAATSANLRFGMDLFRGDGFYSGDIAAARMSNSPRYTTTFVPSTNFENDGNTVANWDFSSGGTTIVDLSGNGHDGTIYGATWVNSCPNEDLDEDGYASWEDCDDGDSSVGSSLEDGDCNGVADLSATDVSNGTPLGVYGSAMAYDPNSGTVILFGGAYQSYGVESNETWSWDGSSWTQLSPASSPPRRRFGSMAYDSTLGGLVLFGGSQYDGTYHGNYLNDTWLWDGSNWQQLSPSNAPSARSVDLVENPTGGVFLHGGQAGKDGCCTKSDSYVFMNGQWTDVTTSGGPGTIQNHQIVYDSTNAQVLLFQSTDTMYHWDGSNWTTSQSTDYPTLSSTNMVFDKARGAVVLTCGFEGSSRSNDVWVWYNEEWSLQSTSSSLPVRNGPNLAYDDQNENIVLYAGQYDWSGGALFYDDTWILE